VAGSSFVFGVDSFKAGRSLRKSIWPLDNSSSPCNAPLSPNFVNLDQIYSRSCFNLSS
jgi:hypothetical protein